MGRVHIMRAHLLALWLLVALVSWPDVAAGKGSRKKRSKRAANDATAAAAAAGSSAPEPEGGVSASKALPLRVPPRLPVIP